MPKVEATLDAAKRLLAHNLPVVETNGKRPFRPGWGNTRLTEADLERIFANDHLNVAIALHQSLYIDIETDSPEGASALERLFPEGFPPTPTWKSARGVHRLFVRPEGLPPVSVVKVDGVEYRVGNNGAATCSVCPPSLHPDTGKAYRWVEGLAPWQVSPAPLPANVVELLRNPPRPESNGQGVVVEPGAKIPHGSRNEVLFRMGCRLRDAGFAEERALEIIAVENTTRCDPPLGADELRASVHSAFSREPSPPLGHRTIKTIPPSPPALSEAAYHGIVGRFLKAVSDHTEAPDAAILAHLLPALGTLIGPKPYIVAGNRHPCRVFFALVGRTNTGRKGTSFAPVNDLMTIVAPMFWPLQHVSGLSSGEGLIVKVADYREKGEDGKERLVKQDKRLYVVEPEFSRVLTMMKREGSVLSQVIRQAFDDGDLATLTVKPRQAIGAHVSLVTHVTPEELSEKLDTLDLANGFANRFLWYYVASDKILSLPEPIPSKVFKGFSKPLAGLGKQKAGPVKLSRSADKQWGRLYRDELREDGPGMVGAILSRGAPIVLRLALIYCLVDGADEVEVDHLNAAMGVWRYGVESAHILFESETGCSLADKVIRLLKAMGPLTRTDINDHLSEKQRKRLPDALQILLESKMASTRKLDREGPGRPAELWFLPEG